MKPSVTDLLRDADLNEWIWEASRRLCDEAKQRIRTDMEAHYSDGYAEAQTKGEDDLTAHRTAMKCLGDAKVAHRHFRRLYLTQEEYNWYRTFLNPPPLFKKRALVFDVMAMAGLLLLSSWCLVYLGWRGLLGLSVVCVVEWWLMCRTIPKMIRSGRQTEALWLYLPVYLAALVVMFAAMGIFIWTMSDEPVSSEVAFSIFTIVVITSTAARPRVMVCWKLGVLKSNRDPRTS